METREQIYAVLIALDGDTLLLPNTAVAEVLSQESLRRVNDGPRWLVGYSDVNGRRVPVVSFEAMNGAPRPEIGRRTRLAVVNGLSGRGEGRQIALLCQGHPHLVTLNRTAVKKQPLSAIDRTELVLTRVKIGNTEAAIPDLEAIETQVAQVVGSIA